jgi:hypothetical protein
VLTTCNSSYSFQLLFTDGTLLFQVSSILVFSTFFTLSTDYLPSSCSFEALQVSLYCVCYLTALPQRVTNEGALAYILYLEESEGDIGNFHYVTEQGEYSTTSKSIVIILNRKLFLKLPFVRNSDFRNVTRLYVCYTTSLAMLKGFGNSQIPHNGPLIPCISLYVHEISKVGLK